MNSDEMKKDLFYSNLVALGFDVPPMSEEHGITFDKNMFCLPNQKAMEVVIHFLFMKLNKVSSKQYIMPWPLLEVKAHREFQKTCYSFLTQIAQESEISFPTVTLSVFSNFGDAVYDLYFAFSTHVVLKTNENYGCPLLRRVTPELRHHKHYIRVLELATNAAVKRFMKATEVSQHHLEIYFNCAKNLMILINELKISNASNEALLEDKMKNLSSLPEDKSITEEISFEESIIKNKEYQKKVENGWTQFENFLSKEEKLWKILSTELQEEEKLHLEGNQFNSTILENLNKIDCNQNKNELWTEGKGLNLYELLKRFSGLLELHNNSILKGNFPQTRLFPLLKDNSECGANFQRLKQLRDQLEKDNVLIKDNIKQLMEGFEVEDDESAIYEHLPPSPSTYTSSINTDMFDIEKFINFSIQENQDKDVSSLSNNFSNDNSSQSAGPSQVETNIASDILSQCFPGPSLLEFKEKLSSEELLKDSGIAVTKKLSDDQVDSKEQDMENMINKNFKKTETILSGNSQEFVLPESWLLEDSLNSQTLGDHLSFLE